MSKDDEQVLCVPASRLGECGIHDGFTRTDGDVVLRALLARGEFHRRGDVEDDPKYRQIVTYDLVISTLGPGPLVFTYHRRGDEERLRQQSCGVGGHVVHDDFRPSGKVSVASFEKARRRELAEELSFDEGPGVAERIEGFIAISGSAVDRVHLGVVHGLLVPGIVRGNSRETSESRMIPVSEFRKPAVLDRFEPWSKIVISLLLL